MTSVLVIGGSGFVGQHLIRTLKQRGIAITVLNRGHNRVAGVQQVIADRTSASDMRAAAAQTGQVDIVIDTSSYTDLHTRLAWEAFAPLAGRWVHLSSAAVYLPARDAPPREDSATGGAPVWGEYGREKSAADMFLLGQTGREPVFIVRPPYLYGPGNDNDRESFVWSRLLARKPVVVPGEGQTPIQFLHVEDLAHLLAALALGPRRRHAVYNAAGGDAVSLKQWVSMCAAAADRAGQIWTSGDIAENIQARTYFPFRDYPCVVNCDRLAELDDWKPQYSLAEGLAQTYSHYDPVDPVQSAVEIELVERLAGRRGNEQ